MNLILLHGKFNSSRILSAISLIKRESFDPARKILQAVDRNNDVTIPELANLIGVTERSIERNIQKLQSDGLLKRVGGRKEGHWEIVVT